MRILILTDDFPPISFGGAGIVAFRTAQKMRELGHEVLVFTTYQKKDFHPSSHIDGLNVCWIYSGGDTKFSGWRGTYNKQALGELKKVLIDFKPDIVHAHNVHGYISYASLQLSKKYCQKVFLTAHDTDIFYCGKYDGYIKKDDLAIQKVFDYSLRLKDSLKQFKYTLNPFRRVLINNYLKGVNKIFAVSGSLEKALKDNGIKKVATVYNGVEIDCCRDDGYLRKKFGLSSDKKIVLMAGRFNSLKGGRLIIPYIQEIKKEFTNFVFIFAGQINGLAREVIAEAKAGGLSDYLLFTDWIEPSDMRQVYASSDVVITPSVYLDVFNLTNIEAMQAQKPVVGTCFGGTAEIVVDGKTGFIVNPYDVKNFAAKIKILLSDKKLASQLGYHGSIRVKEQFTLEKQVKAYLDNYKI